MTRLWSAFGIAAWVIVSPWLLGVSGVAIITWSNLIAGLLALMLVLWEIFIVRHHEL